MKVLNLFEDREVTVGLTRPLGRKTVFVILKVSNIKQPGEMAVILKLKQAKTLSNYLARLAK